MLCNIVIWPWYLGKFMGCRLSSCHLIRGQGIEMLLMTTGMILGFAESSSHGWSDLGVWTLLLTYIHCWSCECKGSCCNFTRHQLSSYVNKAGAVWSSYQCIKTTAFQKLFHVRLHVNRIWSKIQWHRQSNLRPSGLYHSASTNYATARSQILNVIRLRQKVPKS
jgi:hypothetical protein